jgi:ABC-type molybdenum transport system ATPase subunit/photorepair protein PhrA
MTRHSKAFEDKKAELQQAETELRQAIESQSESLESSVFKALKIGAVVSTAVLVSYGIYRMLSKQESSEVEKKQPSAKPTMMDKVVDKVTDVVAGLAVQNISNYLDKLKSDLEKDLKR